MRRGEGSHQGLGLPTMGSLLLAGLGFLTGGPQAVPCGGSGYMWPGATCLAQILPSVVVVVVVGGIRQVFPLLGNRCGVQGGALKVSTAAGTAQAVRAPCPIVIRLALKLPAMEPWGHTFRLCSPPRPPSRAPAPGEGP